MNVKFPKYQMIRRCSVEKMFWTNLQNSWKDIRAADFTLIKFQAKFCSLIVKWLREMSFPKNFAEVSRTSICRSSHWSCSVRKGVLRNFTKFTGKHLCQNLVFHGPGFSRSRFARVQVFQCPNFSGPMAQGPGPGFRSSLYSEKYLAFASFNSFIANLDFCLPTQFRSKWHL